MEGKAGKKLEVKYLSICPGEEATAEVVVVAVVLAAVVMKEIVITQATI